MKPLLFILLLGSASAFGTEAKPPEGSLGKAKPMEHYRSMFRLALSPDPTKHKFLENLIFQCEVATFNPIVYNDKAEAPSYSREQAKKVGYLFKGSNFIIRKVTATELRYVTIPAGALNDKSNYEKLEATVLLKDEHGGFTNTTKTTHYPFKSGSALFFVEMRVSNGKTVIFETSYDIGDYSPIAKRVKPESSGGAGIGGGVFVDDYAICKSTGELQF